jgi:two-component system, NarL family, response regulator DevR
MTEIRVVLVDDHALVRLGLKTLIDDQPDMRVVGEAGTAAEALAVVQDTRPAVVLMDIRLPGGGLEATRQVLAALPETRVVMLTSFADEELVVSAVRAGAAGYLLKEVGNEEVLRAIRAAAAGESALDGATTARLLDRLRASERRAEVDAFRDLSSRELEVLAEVAQGKTNPEIAAALHLGEKTVRNYVSAILGKLNLSNRTELATYAIRHRLDEHLRGEG